MTEIKLNFPHITEYNEYGKITPGKNKFPGQEDTKIEPMCIKGNMNLAVTNRGQVIPCCRCDTNENMTDPEFKKMIDASQLKDYKCIDDIIESDVWKQFYDQLKQNRGPKACWDTCRTNKPEEDKQEMVFADKDGKLKVWERK